jgi:arabinofuranan 3-O-arabinosyltransferase
VDIGARVPRGLDMTTSAASTSEAADGPVHDQLDPLPLTPRARARIGVGAFVLLAYVPLLFMDPGKVEADTKSYLYLDPGRLLAGAGSMWDPHIGMGTVSHQTLGYLFPLGPFYWVLEQVLGAPAWVAQRLWLGTLLVGAGLGIRYLLRTFEIRGPGVPVAMLAYAFTPYAIEFSSRFSVLLGPWAALPWLTAFTVLGLRHRGWKYPALFALTIQLVSSINASALIFALVGPALWYPYAVFALREVRLRDAFGVAWRTALLTILTSLWWIIGLSIQGQYGLDVLRFTESLATVSATAYPYEILRGLGYWFFYGRDRAGFWNEGMADFTQSPGSIFVSFIIPTLGLASAAMMRWRHRAYFVLLLLVGLTIGVAATPYGSPSPLGALFKVFALSSTAGFALRSTARAVPLVVLAFAVFLAVGINLAGDWLRARGKVFGGILVAVVVGGLCMVNAPGLLGGRYYSKYLERDEKLPAYWPAALSALDAKSHATRVLALPGADFAAYRWGDTIDPIEPGLMDRDYVARELIPWGSEPAANLLQALDRRVQEGAFEPTSLAPVARLMGVGDVLLRLDLKTDAFFTALIPAHALWQTFTNPEPPGLGPVQTFGTKIPGSLEEPEIENPARPTTADPPPVAVLPVENALPIVRAKASTSPLVVDGDGEGIIDVSAAGILDARSPVLYSASYETDPTKLRTLAPDGILVLTDSNRRRALRWSGVLDNYGYTEVAGEKALVKDSSDQRLDVFPGSDDNARTVTIFGGVKSVSATSYGSTAFGYTPSERPAAAFDGDPDTAWLADGGIPIKHQVLNVELDKPVTTDHLTLSQPSGPKNTRYISQVTLTFDGSQRLQRPLDTTSRTTAGQTVTFPRRTFSRLSIRVDAVNEHGGLLLANKNPVGFNEVRLRDDTAGAKDVRADETMRLPDDMLHAYGASSLDHPLAIVLSRESTMDQLAMNRQFDLPTARSFTLTGTAKIGPRAHDDAIDTALGIPGAAQGGVTATSNERSTDPIARASSAVDGDPSTAWNSPIGEVTKARLTVTMPGAVALDHLDLQLVADDRHSIPRSIEITSDDGTTRTVDLPAINADVGGKGVAPAGIRFAALHGTRFTIRFPKVAQVKRSELIMPIGVAELGIPHVRRSAPPAALPATCQSDLVTIDGRPFPVRMSGSTADAQKGRELTLEPCAPTATVTLRAGVHEIRTRMTPYNAGAFDVNRLVLSSGAGGDAVAMTALDQGARPSTLPLKIVRKNRTSMTLSVDATGSSPFWLVLGESYNKGWTAKANGHDLGAPQLLDGYANGWLVKPNADGAPITVSVEWTPQRRVFDAILISAAASAACLAILVGAAVRRRRRGREPLAFEESKPGLRPAPWTSALRPSRRAAITGVLVALAVGALLVGPAIGVLLALVVVLALRGPRLRTILVIGPVLLMLGITLYMTLGQLLEHYPPRFDWPTFFDIARFPAWFAVLALAADALLTADWRSESGLDDADA